VNRTKGILVLLSGVPTYRPPSKKKSPFFRRMDTGSPTSRTPRVRTKCMCNHLRAEANECRFPAKGATNHRGPELAVRSSTEKAEK